MAAGSSLAPFYSLRIPGDRDQPINQGAYVKAPHHGLCPSIPTSWTWAWAEEVPTWSSHQGSTGPFVPASSTKGTPPFFHLMVPLFLSKPPNLCGPQRSHYRD